MKRAIFDREHMVFVPHKQLIALSLAAFTTLALLTVSAHAQAAIEPAAENILRAMANNLKALSTISAEYDVDQEIVTLEGQKIQYSASGSIELDRRRGFKVTRSGPYADVEVTFDGKMISVYGKRQNVYIQIDSLGQSIEAATEKFRESTGLDAPAADLLAVDPYAALIDGAIDGALVGPAVVGGVECDHLAFRTESVDWQVWISKSDKPLPLKYVITTKWVTGAPEYTLRLTKWSADTIDVGKFTFFPPPGAKKLENLHADVTGELSIPSEE